MVSNRFGVPKPVTMHDYLERKEYLKRIKKQGKWLSHGGASIGKVGLLASNEEGEVPGEVQVVSLKNLKPKGDITPKANVVHPLPSPQILEGSPDEE